METVLQAARTWIKDELSLADAQVIVAQRGADTGPRPDPPFLVVNLDTFGGTVGTDEKIYQDDSTLQRRGHRRGILHIEAFGPASEDWLEELAMKVDKIPRTVPLSVTSMGQILDLSETLAGTSLEERYARDFNIAYAVSLADTFVPVVDFVTDPQLNE